jgi:hypothetical protein
VFWREWSSRVSKTLGVSWLFSEVELTSRVPNRICNLILGRLSQMNNCQLRQFAW